MLILNSQLDRMKPSKHYDNDMMLFADKAIKRVDDLRVAETIRVNDRFNTERFWILKLLDQQHNYDEKLREAESKRIDAIRAVDVAAVSTANDKSAAQALVLANQVSSSSEVLRTLVANTATTVAKQLEDIVSQFNTRMGSVEKAQYENQGKSGVTDPIMLELVREIKALTGSNSSRGGMEKVAGWVFGGGVVLIGVLYEILKH